jgi:hypothetical protein
MRVFIPFPNCLKSIIYFFKLTNFLMLIFIFQKFKKTANFIDNFLKLIYPFQNVALQV